MSNKHILHFIFFFIPFFTTAQIGIEDSPLGSSSEEIQEPLSGEDRIAWFKENGLYGYRHLKTGAIIVKPEFEDIDRYYSSFMVARKNGRAGVVNQKGEIVIPFEYQKIYASSPDIKNRYPWILAEKNGFCGLISPNGVLFEPFVWTQASYYAYLDSFVLLTKPGVQRLMDRQGKVVLETNYDRWEHSGFYQQKLIYARKNGKVGLIDFQNKVVVPFEYDAIEWIKDSVVCYRENKRSGLNALDGQPILPAEHGYIKPLSSGLFNVSTPDAKKHGLVNSTGIFLLPIEYNDIFLIAANSAIAAKKSGTKLAVFDLNGKQLTDFIFEEIKSRDDVPDLFFGKIDFQKYRLLNGKGEFLSPETFQSINTYATAFTGTVRGKTAFFRLDGKQVTEFKYSGHGFDSLLNRDRLIQHHKLPTYRTWIGQVYINGQTIFLDSEGQEYIPTK
jgi:hypothetical protein